MKKNIGKIFISLILMISLIWGTVVPVNAQSAILKTVNAQGDAVTQLFSDETSDGSYMVSTISNVDQANNSLTVEILMTNANGATSEVSKPVINIAMTNDVTQYFDINFIEATNWELSDELNTEDNGVAKNYKYTYSGTLGNAEDAESAKLVYTLKLKDGVNADDLVGTTFQVLESGLISGGSRTNLEYGYGPDNSTCSIPTFTFVKQEETVKTGISSNNFIIFLGVILSVVLIIALTRKSKMSRI